MRSKYEYVKFDWLLQDVQSTSQVLNDQDIPWTKIPLPSHIGSGGYEGWFLANGILIYHANYQFNPEVSGQLIPLAKVSPIFREPTLMIQTLAKGRVVHRDQLSPHDFIFGDGVDLFRFCEEASVTPMMDTSSEIEMMSIMIGQSFLSDLIGEELAGQLLNQLGLQPLPRVVVKPIPSYVNESLQTCLKTEFSPVLKKVAAQARVLEYLSKLTKYICEDLVKKPLVNKKTKERVKELKQYLAELEGKLPTMNSLALQFGRSARLLNEEFQQEYGESIFNFVLNHRLVSAHEAVANSTISLKQMAERLGYAHVNHFSAAFKRKFGYSPGYLRKK